jgi:ATP-dependent DNA ligase
MKKITLYQKSRKGKTKILKLWTSGETLYTEWGTIGGKTQTTSKVCEGMNIGKSNETSPTAQAEKELEAKVILKKKEGYDENVPTEEETIVKADIDLDNIPTNFCPDKPISKAPKTIVDDKTTFGQRKYNGHCLILVKGKNTSKIYSRRMEDLTEYLQDIHELQTALKRLPHNTMVIGEYTFFRRADQKESPRHVAMVVTRKDRTDANERYKKLGNDGYFEYVTFDSLFYKGKFIGDKPYTERLTYFSPTAIIVPEIYQDWKKKIPYAEKHKWEGFVLRRDDKSQISYSMDGTAHRAGSYKYKFLKTDDFFVTEWLKGEAGKHAKFYSKFKVCQYDDSGKIIDRGYVGPGKLSHEELEELTNSLDAGKIKKNFVVEVEFQDIQDSGKLQFGIIQRLRPDKTDKECITEE